MMDNVSPTSDMPDSSLVYLRLLYPFLLALPLLTLLPSPSEPPPELPGIRPVTIRTVIPRRAFTLTILSLLALTSFADAAILVADLLTANGRDHAHLEGLAFTSGSVYAIGGFLVWAVAAIVCEWRARWGDRGMLVLGTLGLVCEIPNLVLLTMKEVHTRECSYHSRADTLRRLRKAIHYPLASSFCDTSPPLPHPLHHCLLPHHPV